jgi:acyl-CoA synthetase (AMP-forming)/AMP-acid ligase II
MTAFYTGTKEKTELRVELKEKLPAYMIPNKFNNLLSLPFLKNGKIDRQLLATM